MFALASGQKLALHVNRPVLEARRRIAAGLPNTPATDDEFFDLAVLAYGEDAAQEALVARINARLRADV